MLDPHSQESRGFAFVEMRTTEGAEKALAKANKSELDGRTIVVDKACVAGALG